ncbi:MAG: carbohydrate ABC transporter permease [Clostridiales bacterium]|nr:carbohydrate ABC transporter permease [Clostridiales bacterium]
MTKTKKKKFFKMGLVNWIILIVLSLYVILLCSYLLFGLFTSVNTIPVYDEKIYFPGAKEWKWGFKNYVNVFKSFSVTETLSNQTTIQADFFAMTFNSILFAGLAAFAKCAAIYLVAYATSRYAYVFSKLIYTFVIVAMVIPIIGSTPSQIVIIKALGLYEKMTGVALVAFSFLGMYFLVVHAVLQALPKDYAEAAYLDGASEWTVMIKIMLPLVWPTIATIFLIVFIENWNSYGYILIYLRSYPTLSYGVFKQLQTSGDYSNLMYHPTMKIAGAYLVALPVITLFIVFRNKLMKNVTMGGVKE